MQKVLFVSRKWPPAVGGMENYSKELVHALRPLVELEVWALPGRSDGRPPSLPKLAFFVLSALVRLAGRGSRAILHVGDLVLWPLAALYRLKGGHSVITVYGLDISFANQPSWLAWLYKQYLTIAVAVLGKRQHLIAISRATAELCESIGFSQVTIIPLGVSFEQVQNEEYPNRSEDRYILFVGRQVRRKGLSWFIHNVLPFVRQDIRLKVAGPPKDPLELVALSSSPAEYLGKVSVEQLKRLRADAIAVIMPNISTAGEDFEGFGLTAVETARDGGILITSGIEGIADAIVPGHTALIAPEGNPQEWVKTIDMVADWPREKRLGFIKRARDIVEEKYSWRRVAEETVDAYRRAVS